MAKCFASILLGPSCQTCEGDSTPLQNRKEGLRGYHSWIERWTFQVSWLHIQYSWVLTLQFFSFVQAHISYFYIVKWSVFSFKASLWLRKVFLTQRIFKILPFLLLALGFQFLHLNLWSIWNLFWFKLCNRIPIYIFFRWLNGYPCACGNVFIGYNII